LNQERFQLYTDLIGYGLEAELLKLIPGRVTAIIPSQKNSFLVTTSKTRMSLWLHHGRAESLADQLLIMEYCRNQGFSGFLEVLPLSNGAVYGKADERRWFYLTEWSRGVNISYRNLNHLKAAVGLLAAFRKSAAGLATGGLLRLKEKPRLTEKLKEIDVYFAAFQMLATYRVNPTQFDRLFLEMFPYLRDGVAETLMKFQNSKYQELVADLTTTALAINDFSRSNLRVTPEEKVNVVRLKNFRFDLPVVDLAVLLLKSGRSQRWERQWFEALVAEYQKYFSISTVEMAIIEAYLSFPWNIYRLASRYYLNRAVWPTYLFVAKLKRLIADEEKRRRFLKTMETFS
jgi:CotS family spore coat protein